MTKWFDHLMVRWPDSWRLSYNGNLCKASAAPQPALAKFQKANMHIPDGYLSPSTCAVLYGAAAPFWYTALQRVKKSSCDAPGALAVGDGGAFLCHHDVQPALARRHHGARRGRGDRHHYPGAVGFDSCHFHCPGDSGRLLWRRRHHHARRQLLQHGDCGIAGGVCGLPPGGGTRGSYLFAQGGGRRPGGLHGHQCLGVLRRGGIWDSASLLQGPERRAALRSLPFKHRHSRHDDRPLNVCRPRGAGTLRGSGGLFPANQPCASEAHGARQLGRRARRLRARKAKACGEPCARCGLGWPC